MAVATLTRSTISVHFWNLSSYVGGNLVGGWVDLDDFADLDEFKSKVSEVTRDAEEYLLSDYESDYGISFDEYENLDRIWEVHEALCDIHESEREAFGEFLAHVGGSRYLDYALSNWRDAYCGNFDSIEDYAWHMADDIWPDLAKCPAGFTVKVDTVAWECDYWISSTGNVFRNI